MEIRLTGIHVSESTMFKIDLIVWKFVSVVSVSVVFACLK